MVRVFQLSTRAFAAAGVVVEGLPRLGRGAGGMAGLEGEWGGEEDDEEDEEDDEDEGEDDEEEEDDEASGGAALQQPRRGGRPSPFVAADSVSVVNLSDLLDGGDSEDGDESDAGSDDADERVDDAADAALDPIRALDLRRCTATYIRTLRGALGEQQFGQLCGALAGEEERGAVVRALQVV